MNNAGILRDRMLFSMTEEEWDAVIKVHLKGTFATSRHAAAYWRDRAKAGEANDARLVNTTSVAGLYANPGQTNYGAAKAGDRHLHPDRGAGARSVRRDRQRHRPGRAHPPDGGPGPARRDDRQVRAPMGRPGRHLARLGPVGRRHRPGHRVVGLVLAIAEGWRRGPSTEDVPADPSEVDASVRKLLADARPRTTMAEVGG